MIDKSSEGWKELIYLKIDLELLIRAMMPHLHVNRATGGGDRELAC